MTATSEPRNEKVVRSEEWRSVQRGLKRSLSSTSTGSPLTPLPPKPKKSDQCHFQGSVSEIMPVAYKKQRNPAAVDASAFFKGNSRQPPDFRKKFSQSRTSTLMFLLCSAFFKQRAPGRNSFQSREGDVSKGDDLSWQSILMFKRKIGGRRRRRVLLGMGSMDVPAWVQGGVLCKKRPLK